jgi:hypothetical protein
MTYSSTDHLLKPADPAQMSEWRAETCGLTATVYYPRRATIMIIPMVSGNMLRVVTSESTSEQITGKDATTCALTAFRILGIKSDPLWSKLGWEW